MTKIHKQLQQQHQEGGETPPTIGNRSIVEIMNDFNIPKEFEGVMRFMADHAKQEAKANGLTDAESQRKVGEKAAALVGTSEVPEGAHEEAGIKSYLDFHEKSLVDEGLRAAADVSGAKKIRRMRQDDYQKQLGEVIDAGGFRKQIEQIARRDGISIADAKKTVTLTGNPSLVATMYLAEYIRSKTHESRYREYAMKVPMGGTESAQAPKVTAEPTSVDHTEAAALSDQAISIGNVALSLSEVAVMTKVSNRTLAKPIGNFRELVGRILGIQQRRKQDSRYAIGSGTSTPLGITNFTISKTVAVSGPIGYVHIVEAMNTLGDEYMEAPEDLGLCWIGNQGGKEALMKIRDDNGLPLWTMLDGSNFNSFRVMGIPYVNLSGITGTGNSGAGTTLYLSAHRLACYIGDGEDETLRVDESVYANELSTAFIYSVTDDARQADTAAIVELTDVEKSA